MGLTETKITVFLTNQAKAVSQKCFMYVIMNRSCVNCFLVYSWM